MALNRRVLDVSGRLSLLSPQPEVLNIVKRAGIHNVLRVFETEADLIKTSEDIIMQTTSFKLGDIQSIAQGIQQPQPPQSEFDQLRNEIGSVFGGQESPSQQSVPEPPKTKGLYRFDQESAPQMQPAPESMQPSLEQEIDDVFSQFEAESNEATDDFAEQSNQYMAPPVQPQFTPPSAPQGRGGFVPPQPPQFQARQYTPPPPQTPQARPPQQKSFEQPAQMTPPPRAFTPPEPVKPMPDFSAIRPETQRFPAAPGAPSKPLPPRKSEPPEQEFFEDDVESFDVPSRKKPPKPPKIDDSFEIDDDPFDDEIKKKSPAGMLVLIVLILAIGGAGVFFGYSKFMKKPGAPVPTPTTVQPSAPATPQIPVDDAQTPDQPKVEEQKVTEEIPEPPKVVEKKPAPKPVARSKPAAKPQVRETERPAPKPAAPAPAPTVNQVVISSNPSGASVIINGQTMGTTPFTWDKPFFGAVNVAVSKSGYKQSSKTIEFTGGTLRESFTLDKEAPPPPAPAPVVKAEPKPTPPPPVPVDEPDDFGLDPDPAPAPAPAPTAAAFSGSGDASIFIASIPPVADVYLDGKLVGKTNVSELKLPAGTHNLKFVKGPKELTKAITVQPGKNPSQMVRLP